MYDVFLFEFCSVNGHRSFPSWWSVFCHHHKLLAVFIIAFGIFENTGQRKACLNIFVNVFLFLYSLFARPIWKLCQHISILNVLAWMFSQLFGDSWHQQLEVQTILCACLMQALVRLYCQWFTVGLSMICCRLISREIQMLWFLIHQKRYKKSITGNLCCRKWIPWTFVIHKVSKVLVCCHFHFF